MSSQTKTFPGTISVPSGAGVNYPYNCIASDSAYTDYYWLNPPPEDWGYPAMYGAISFDLPSTATISGIELILTNNHCDDYRAFFTAYLRTGTGTVISTAMESASLSGYVATLSIGGSSNLWNVDTAWLTPSNINSNLQVYLRADLGTPSSEPSRPVICPARADLYFDYLTLKIYYSSDSSGIIILPPVPDPEEPTLKERAIRAVAAENSIFKRQNVRYRGARESYKFNYTAQVLQTQFANSFRTIKDKFTNLEDDETELYPSETELAAIQHIRQQLLFKEWLQLKDVSNLWFD